MLFSGLWIAFSDRLVGLLASDAHLFSVLHTSKEWVFVLAGAGTIFLIVRRERRARLQAELALQKSEEALREQIRFQQHLLDSMPMPIFYKDKQGIYRGCNTSFERYFGRPKDTIVGKSVYDMAARELADKYDRMDAELFQDPGVQVYDYAVRHADGTMRDVVFYKSTFTDVTGRVAGLIGAMLDITERKNAERTLRETNEMLEALVQASPLAIVTFDREGKVMLWNPAAERIFGWSLGEVVGRFNPIVQKEKKQEFLSLLERVMHGESLVNVSLRRGRKDGSGIEVSVWSAPLRNAGREPVGIISMITDITERKKVEDDRGKLIADIRKALDAVSRSKKEWQDTFDSITDMISILDKDWNVIKANKAFSAHLGLSPPEVINRKCYELMHHGAFSPVAGCPHQRTVRDRVPATEEVFDEQSGKTYGVSTFPYFSPDGEIIGSIHIARDITEEKEREMRMIMTERLASLGQMASGIAHEINNPLESVMISAEMLLLRVAKDKYDHAQFEKYLKIIDEEVLRCRDITSNMLSFSRLTMLSKSDIDVHQLLDKTIDLVGYQGRLKNVTVTRKYGEQLLVSGNEGELRQVFLVLLINALDAMENKGAITIGTGTQAGSVWVTISDTGPGIAPEDMQRIFHPFFSTKTREGGTGLGLSIAHRIIANHRGSLTVFSEQGRGAAFTITLPR